MVSDELYNKLINDYKEYDRKQKDVITSLVKENKKLKQQVGALDSYIDELTNLTPEEVKELLSIKESYKDLRAKYKDLKYKSEGFKRSMLSYESLYVRALYPEYDEHKLSTATLLKIKEILDNEI